MPDHPHALPSALLHHAAALWQTLLTALASAATAEVGGVVLHW